MPALLALPYVGPFVSWLLGPMGKIAMIALAFFAWTAYQRHTASATATAQCQAAELRADLKEITRQRDAAWLAIEMAEKRQAIAEATMARLEREGDAIKKETAGLKTACDVPRHVTKRMSNIR